jgi:hypothetical protein
MQQLVFDDIQVGKLYIAKPGFNTFAWSKPAYEKDNIMTEVLIKSEQPFIIVSRYHDRSQNSNWIKVLTNDSNVWIRFDQYMIKIFPFTIEQNS